MEEKNYKTRITPDGRALGRVSFKNIYDWLDDVIYGDGSEDCSRTGSAAEYGRSCARRSLYVLLSAAYSKEAPVSCSDVKVVWKEILEGLGNISNDYGRILVERMRDIYLKSLDQRITDNGILEIDAPCEVWGQAKFLDAGVRATLAVLAAYGLPIIAGPEDNPVLFFPDFSECGFFRTDSTGRELDEKVVTSCAADAVRAFVNEWCTLGKLIDRVTCSAPSLSFELFTSVMDYSWAVFLLPAENMLVMAPPVDSDEELFWAFLLKRAETFRRILPDRIPSERKLCRFKKLFLKSEYELEPQDFTKTAKEYYTVMYGEGYVEDLLNELLDEEDEDDQELFDDDDSCNMFGGEMDSESFLNMTNMLKGMLDEMQNDYIRYSAYVFPRDIGLWVENEIKSMTKRGWKGDEAMTGRLRFFTGFRQAIDSIRDTSGICALISDMMLSWNLMGRCIFPSCDECSDFMDCLGIETVVANFVIETYHRMADAPVCEDCDIHYPMLFYRPVRNMIKVLEDHGVVGKDVSPERLSGWVGPIRELTRINDSIGDDEESGGGIFLRNSNYQMLPDEWAKLFSRTDSARPAGNEEA